MLIQALSKKKPVSLKVAVFILAVFMACSFIIRLLSFESHVNISVPYQFPPPPPVLSVKGGFFQEPFNLEISHANSDAKIFFTTDGSEPGINSTLYLSPVSIRNRDKYTKVLSRIPTSPRWKASASEVNKATVIRAIAVLPDRSKSKMVTTTYFVSAPSSSNYTMPVISLVTDPDNFFDYRKGIYVMGKKHEDKDGYAKKNIDLSAKWWDFPANYHSRGMNSERPVSIEFFNADGQRMFSADAGIRIHGGATRAYSQKSLRIYFRKKYGVKPLRYQLFPDDTADTFFSFVLRNSGNDWDKTMFRNNLIHALLKTTRLDVQSHLPVIVFLNGEYWGIHQMCYYQDENYLTAKHHIPPKSIAILNGPDDIFRGGKANNQSYVDLIRYASTHDLSDSSAFNYLAMRMGVENFIDYMAAEIFIANTDWPLINERMWKQAEKTPVEFKANDGRWRWMVTDADYGFGFSKPASFNMFDYMDASGNAEPLFAPLMRNKNFREAFVSRFEELLNTAFHPDTVINEIKKNESMMSPEMAEHLSRWRKPASMDDWRREVQVLCEFATNRPGYVRRQLKEFLKKYD